MLVSRVVGVVALSLLAATGCRKESASPPVVENGPAPAAVAPAANAPAAAAPVATTPSPATQVPEDRSLPLNEYLQAGMPAPDRAWSGEDMKRAAELLTAMEQEKSGRLPRYESPNSGALLRRLAAEDNLGMYRNLSIPLEQRMPDALTYINSANRILKLYLEAYNRGEATGSELVELIGGHLRTSEQMVRLTDELLPTLDPKDPTYPTRIGGFNKMKAGLANVVAGALTSLTEAAAYRPGDLKRLAGYMEVTLPHIVPALTDSGRTETLVRLRSFIDDPKMQEFKPELERTLQAVDAPAK